MYMCSQYTELCWLLLWICVLDVDCLNITSCYACPQNGVWNVCLSVKLSNYVFIYLFTSGICLTGLISSDYSMVGWVLHRSSGEEPWAIAGACEIFRGRMPFLSPNQRKVTVSFCAISGHRVTEIGTRGSGFRLPGLGFILGQKGQRSRRSRGSKVTRMSLTLLGSLQRSPDP